ncbi:MAG: hypothetical protein ACE5DM_05945, partial [Candidatus Nanoarchaeia archaeon]
MSETLDSNGNIDGAQKKTDDVPIDLSTQLIQVSTHMDGEEDVLESGVPVHEHDDTDKGIMSASGDETVLMSSKNMLVPTEAAELIRKHLERLERVVSLGEVGVQAIEEAVFKVWQILIKDSSGSEDNIDKRIPAAIGKLVRQS